MRSFWLCILCAALAAGALVLPAQAQEKAAVSGAPFAIVDMDEVLSGYESYWKANEDFYAYSQEVDRQLELNRRLRFLNDQEVQEIKDLRAAVVLTSKQRTRLEEMEVLSDIREEELTLLEQKGNTLTPQEQAYLNQLIEAATKRAPALNEEERRLIKERQQRNQQMSEPFNQAINAALESAAKSRGVSVIFKKDTVLWAAIDLTEAVKKILYQPPKPDNAK